MQVSYLYLFYLVQFSLRSDEYLDKIANRRTIKKYK